MKLIIIGTAPDTHIRMTSPYVSAYHAELLLLDNGDILLKDKASRNGTFLNGNRVTPNKEVTVTRGSDIVCANESLDWSRVPVIQDAADTREVRGIGTDFRNKYQLQGDGVSRFHATMKLKKDNKWYIQDHSRNGTTVNGMRVAPEQELKLSRRDRIVCAGHEVPNPYTGKIGSQGGPGRGLWIAIGVAALCLVGLLAWLLIPRGSSAGKEELPVYTDQELYSKYKNTTILMVGAYHFKVSAGNLDIEDMLGWPTEVVLSPQNKLVPAKNGNLLTYTGTGFFVSEDAKIITNLHIARPWLYTSAAEDISNYYKQRMAQVAAEVPQLNAYVGQVKVEGVHDMLAFLPNGKFFAEENLVKCMTLEAGDNKDIDVALLQSVVQKLPDEHNVWVNLDEAVVADSAIHVGQHIYTMGFPLGLSAQDLSSSKGIQLLARAGNITQDGDITFGFDAASYGGASGSPIFNMHGQLVGILNAGFTQSQGFNYGVKAVYAKELLDKTVKR